MKFTGTLIRYLQSIMALLIRLTHPTLDTILAVPVTFSCGLKYLAEDHPPGKSKDQGSYTHLTEEGGSTFHHQIIVLDFRKRGMTR